MTFEPRKKLRIIVLVHEDFVPPDSLNGLSDKEKLEIKTEFDVVSTLKKMGHDVYPIGLYNQLNVIGDALLEHKPHIAFNLLEEFHGYPLYDQHVVSYLELMKQSYTGCNPRGMTLAHDKALTKMILSYHRLLVPNFAVFPLNRKVRRPKRLKFPLLVKSISEEGSVGIAQASIVHDDEKLRSASILFIGRTRLRRLPSSTSRAGDLRRRDRQSEHSDVCAVGAGDGEVAGWAENIATLKVKWDPTYQEKSASRRARRT
jgi:D-alanine-D-alanine ligase